MCTKIIRKGKFLTYMEGATTLLWIPHKNNNKSNNKLAVKNIWLYNE